MTVPIWGWAGTLAVFAVLLAADLMLAKRAGGGLREKRRQPGAVRW
jgi:hypothetical protein